MEFKPVIQSSNVSVLQPKRKKHERTPIDRQKQWVRLWQNSDLSQAEFCRQHQLHIKTFALWRLKWMSDKIASASLASSLQPSQQTPVKQDLLFEIELPSQVKVIVRGLSDINVIASLIREVA